MIEFNRLEDLLQEIENDKQILKGPANRYPLRIILLDDDSYMHDLVQKIKATKCRLSDKLDHDKSWIQRNALFNHFNSIKETSIIYPFSEVFRYYTKDEADGLLEDMFLRPNDNNIRIYVPLIGLDTTFHSFWDNYARKDEGPPVWRLITAEHEFVEKTVYLCDTNVVTLMPVVENSFQWLSHWESDDQVQVITKAEAIKWRWANFLPSKFLNKKELNHPKDFFVEIYGLRFNKPFDVNEYSYWNRLLNDYESFEPNRDLSADVFLQDQIGISSFQKTSPSEIAGMFLRTENRYKRWLVTMIAHQNTDLNSYFIVVLRSLNQYDSMGLMKALYYHILDDFQEKYINQRRSVIESLSHEHRILAEEFIDDIITVLDAQERGMDLITNYTIEEQSYILEKAVEANNLEILYDKLPKIKDYLDWRSLEHLYKEKIGRFSSYFLEYARSKLGNKKTGQYEIEFEEFNGDLDAFYKWFHRVEEIPKDAIETKTVQLDGVGAEWLPFIYNIIVKNAKLYSKDIKTLELRRANLPSITECNKIDGATFVRDYDSVLIHGNDGYQYPTSVFQEMELIEKLIKNLLETTKEDIVITADHGATCMCHRQFGARSIILSGEPKHGGRYMEHIKGLKDRDDFFEHKSYYVALKHNTINSINKTPKWEVHGGATPEELLVPYIVVRTLEDFSLGETTVVLADSIIKYNDKILKVGIRPKPKDDPWVLIQDEGRIGKLVGRYYEFDISGLNEGTQKLDINIDGKLHSVAFNIIGGIIKEDLFA